MFLLDVGPIHGEPLSPHQTEGPHHHQVASSGLFFPDINDLNPTKGQARPGRQGRRAGAGKWSWAKPTSREQGEPPREMANQANGSAEGRLGAVVNWGGRGRLYRSRFDSF